MTEMTPIFCPDPVYCGNGADETACTFTEPLLIELYHSAAVQRLKFIYQGGITAFIKPERQTTRLDHSVGVALLLRRLGADVTEQAAGLLHDAPHTALSHVVDFVFPSHEHTYHEEHREEMLAHSDLPAILTRHGLDWQWVTDADHFSLLEQPLPRLCADRLDYFFRDGLVDWRLFTAADVQNVLAHLRVWEGQVVVDDGDVACWLGDMFMRLDDLCWCGLNEVGWYAAAAEALRAALAQGVIAERDFFGTDVALMDRVRAAGSPDIQRWLALLRPDVTFARDDTHPDLWALPKVRAIDPPVLVNGKAVALSALDPAFGQRRAEYIAGKQGHWGLRIVTAV